MLSPLREAVRMLSICSLIRKAKQSLLLKINLWREEQILSVWLSDVWGADWQQKKKKRPGKGEEKTIKNNEMPCYCKQKDVV